MATPGPFAHLTLSELTACAQRLYDVEPADRDDAFYEDVEALRDELVLRSRGGGAGNAGVREPRRPPPGSGAPRWCSEPAGAAGGTPGSATRGARCRAATPPRSRSSLRAASRRAR